MPVSSSCRARSADFDTTPSSDDLQVRSVPRALQHHRAAYLKALQDKTWTQKMAEQGIRLLPEADYGPDAFGKHTVAEVEKWRKLAVDAKISVD
jgi:hypothetical protein